MTTDHAARAHARFSPSQSTRFIACPGSVMLSERAPEQIATEHALRGTAAHEVLELALRDHVSPRTAYSRLKSQRAVLGDSVVGVPIDLDRDDLAAVSTAVQFIRGLLEYHGNEAEAAYETRVAPFTPAAPGETAGTADALISVPAEKLLYVIDYKHGKGVNVEAKENTQMMQYAAGALRSDFGEHADTIILVIIQPRVPGQEPWKVWGTDRKRVELYERQLDRAVRIALSPDAELIPGEPQCRWCPAAGLPCQALQNKSLGALGLATKGLRGSKGNLEIEEVTELDLATIIKVVKHKGLIERWLKSAEKAAVDYARRGHKIPGKKLVRPSGRRAWYGKDENVAEELARALGLDDPEEVFEKKLPGLIETENRIIDKLSEGSLMPLKEARGRAKRLMAELTEVRQGSWHALQLVDKNDPKPEVPATTLGQLNIRSGKYVDENE